MVRYWWVSQNKTFTHEVGGGYLWSPITNNRGKRVAAYDFMTEVQPGDVVFSFANTYIQAIGVAYGEAIEAEKPPAFGKAGDSWAQVGWKVPVDFVRLDAPIQPKNHMNILGPVLPAKYSPIRVDGTGNQQYFFPVPEDMAFTLLNLLGNPRLPDPGELIPPIDALSLTRDDQDIVVEPTLTDTEKSTLIQARRGQGLFRSRVRVFEPVCRVTGVSADELLIASHIKPWKASNNQERLDGNNGLFLSPHVDKLFDAGFISFTRKGHMLVSSQLDGDVLPKWSIDPTTHYPALSDAQDYFMDYHREERFREAVT